MIPTAAALDAHQRKRRTDQRTTRARRMCRRLVNERGLYAVRNGTLCRRVTQHGVKQHGMKQHGTVATRNSRVLRPISDLAFFSQCFIETGALAWVNYFALRAQSLHARLRKAGALRRHADAAWCRNHGHVNWVAGSPPSRYFPVRSAASRKLCRCKSRLSGLFSSTVTSGRPERAPAVRRRRGRRR